ncbi:MAG: hypothetical protein A3G60_00720 [Candidatus Ryanbacteria bacterium RIFCSPLOWO2_12_FULL_47_9c]|uniref:UDP-N-acetylmuramate--L-alanine ligase n=2 Tax=Candidatus Ryaniibacteriota TaxID=1817914 RepID=A0A1G2H680_9BACT|nr:MAG: hypothetical protein A2844_00590 [Candidatus Ryanbacteria bacterium RIFCSPHIGHO2_01_FULL_48_80]OGZ49501.1 MAG: hypothetical protein A3C83_02370 [Candidatus Ryanbacteria bacterium RIFCSPHIGHO2_02_FULL_47_25]OGZ56202.1 MAG: hypothetical protein A3J04_00965 [Candidatus Ryanbacteria bacterium RIFCSPLOWO2_02_FULL_47_14]OGZ57731.1 MAG: hypothetical protein A3G60_00720 [Candidatus Ryanbacteria bacterium RIFCSPLOWO2_12_FULL_47_9c]
MKYFFVGIKGVGVCGVATIYKEHGNEVLGSDTDEVFFTDAILERLKIPVVSFDPVHITPDIARVIYSSAYTVDHPQIKKALELNIPTAPYQEALAEIFNERTGVLVTGTHGKTTSAAMIGKILEEAERDPTVIVGGALIQWDATARAGAQTEGLMVAEGDEYQAKILSLKPKYLLLTNIDYDHPDFYPTEESYRAVFQKLLQSLPDGAIVVAPKALRSFVDPLTNAKKIFFGACIDPPLSLMLWGAHNQTNALGVIALAYELGIPEEKARATLKNFAGTKRRMELYTGENDDIVVIDDYAHHPTEIQATLFAVREHYPERKIIAYFQPHTYSRTKTFLEDFGSSFDDADSVALLDVYGSAREKDPSFDMSIFVQQVKKHHEQVDYVATIDNSFSHAKKNASKGSVVITLGAGDVWRVAQMISTKLAAS